MNKVVCYVCGTTYPENVTQCPICGYAQNAEKAKSSNSGDSTYTYVKGGRFSKANVKKRNQEKQSGGQSAKPPKKKKSSAAPIILIIVLLLAIIAVTGYIALRFFIPNDYVYEGLGNLTLRPGYQEVEEETTEATAPESSEQTESTAPSLECTSVSINTDSIEFDSIDSTYQLDVRLEPDDTTDTLSFVSSNPSVAAVNEKGLITAVGEGSAVVTVTCGSASAQCSVEVTVEEELNFNRKEITFSTEGESWLLYNGPIPIEDIIWSSDDNNVATIENGKVAAVGEGDTVVHGIYNEQTVTCVIHCKFEDGSQGATGDISEAAGGDGAVYSLYNPYGYADDVTINPGEKFTLKLVDEEKNEITDAEWSVSNANVCTFSNNIVVGVGTGMAKVTATYEGKTYTCVVRVN